MACEGDQRPNVGGAVAVLKARGGMVDTYVATRHGEERERRCKRWYRQVRYVCLRFARNYCEIREIIMIISYSVNCISIIFFFFFQAEDGIRDVAVTGVQTCALPI